MTGCLLHSPTLGTEPTMQAGALTGNQILAYLTTFPRNVVEAPMQSRATTNGNTCPSHCISNSQVPQRSWVGSAGSWLPGQHCPQGGRDQVPETLLQNQDQLSLPAQTTILYRLLPVTNPMSESLPSQPALIKWGFL